jgi:hypothetical protein
VSKRHQASRRKTYGRRQHEVRERHDRDQHSESGQFEISEWGPPGQADPLGFLDQRGPRARFVLGD